PFKGNGGKDLDLGLIDYQQPEAMMRRTQVRHCTRSDVLADAGKFGHRACINTLPFAPLATLVTNRTLSVEVVARREKD
ncbi:DeoR/GlpR transcriptional regulator, partial [Pseudomonas syringae pv. tagetis]